MIEKIKAEVLSVYKKLEDNGFDAYFIGGCVRNLLMAKDVLDWDITTNATPDQIQSLFPNSFYDNKFGTVGVLLKNSDKKDFPAKNYVEVTTYRTEQGYTDKRRPDVVVWGKSIEEDLSRRDFTVNAIALKLKTKNEELRTKKYSGQDQERITNNDEPETLVVDPYEGRKDIEVKIIRTVGDPSQRFAEDALRLLRAIRIATQLGFAIEEATWGAIVKNAPSINHISNERIRNELLKILATDFPFEGVKLLDASGLLEQIIPELVQGKDISQARPGRHHTTDVFTHGLMSLKFCPSQDPIVRFATLIHDVGKPQTAKEDEKGLVIFYNHETAGSRLAKEICQRLRFSKEETDKVFTLVRWHMFTVDEKITDAAVRRFIRRVGVKNVKDIIDLRIGDRLGGGTQTAESWRLKLFKKRVEDQLKPSPFSINDLEVDGNDIMKVLNIKPGPKVGEILQQLFEEVDEDLSRNKKDYLLDRIKNLVK